ncbi:hypothetical protein AK972_3842 [Pseudomonas yamanorum]|nr:hypothetical protein AK972_3842 [Pseudomonas yamanorum]
MFWRGECRAGNEKKTSNKSLILVIRTREAGLHHGRALSRYRPPGHQAVQAMIGLQVPKHILRLGLLLKRADKGVRCFIEHGGYIERLQLRNQLAKRCVGIGGKTHDPAAAIFQGDGLYLGATVLAVRGGGFDRAGTGRAGAQVFVYQGVHTGLGNAWHQQEDDQGDQGHEQPYRKPSWP